MMHSSRLPIHLAIARSRAVYWRQALVFSVIALLGLGLVIAASIDGPKVGLIKALSTRSARILIGLVAFGFAYRLNLERARGLILPLWSVAVVACLVPRLLGDHTKGAYRWIEIGSFSFQPVELLKVLSVFATAELLERRRPVLQSFVRGVLPVVTVPVLAAGVLLQQPDIGHAFFIVATCGILILSGGTRVQHTLLLAAVAAVVLYIVLGWFGHSRARVGEFFSGEPGFQLSRSLMAFAEGGWAGVGLGEGWVKMGFLPEARNDFVLAIIANELGLIGSLVVVGLYVLFFTAATRVAEAAASSFLRLIGIGFAVMLVVQACINILGVTFQVPDKGIDLPFLSSGGTNLVFALATVGILCNLGASATAGRAGAPPVRDP